MSTDQHPTTTRAEHITWTKERAAAELDGTVHGRRNAVASVCSDLTKHQATSAHPARQLAALLLLAGALDTDPAVRRFIEGIQ